MAAGDLYSPSSYLPAGQVLEGNCSHQYQADSTGPTNGQLKSQTDCYVSPLYGSFSFNSYQDILVAPAQSQQQHLSGSAFSAEDVKILSPYGSLAATSGQRKQAAASIRQTSSTNLLRLNHSRNRSFGVHKEFKALQLVDNSVSDLIANTHQQQKLASPPSSSRASDCNKQIATSKRRVQSIGSLQKYDQLEPPVASSQMSQTLQSIHSLSMQLNQVASLRGSHCDMSSSPQSPIGNATGANSALSSSGKLGRLVGKKASRVKELLLQNLGKADRTTDELFQLYEENFYKQQTQALKLQKEFKSYVNSLKGSQEASKSLSGCLQTATGDYQSARHDLVCENLSQLEHLNDDLMDKLQSQVLVSLNEYLSQFSDLRDKIAKRRRKLIDYDSSRRIYELMLAQVNKRRQMQQQLSQQQGQQQPPRSGLRAAFMLSSSSSSSSSGGRQHQPANAGDNSATNQIQSATNQLVDEARLLKLREQYNYCKIMYETINSELLEELPMVYEKKMKHLLMSLQNYFSLQAQFHLNAGKLFATASDVIDELPMAMHHHQHQHHHHQQQQHHHQLHHHQPEFGSGDKVVASGASSSGMGSSRGGDSSLDSSSSPDDGSSNGGGSPALGHPVVENAAEIEEEDDDDDDEEEAIEPLQVKLQLKVAGKEEIPAEAQLTEMASGEVCSTGEKLPLSLQSSAGVQVENHQTCDSMESAIEPSSELDLTNVESAVKSQQQQQGAMGDADVKVAPELTDDDDKNKLDAKVSDQSAAAKSPSVLDDMKKEETNQSGEQQVGYKSLYKVKTSYKYLAEDVDELCFEADEIIQVVEFDDAQEQEEGWLVGIREVNGQRGLFPANFTRPI